MIRIRDMVLALSLANLLFYQIWSELLPGCYGHYFLKTPPVLNVYLAMMGVVLLTAFLLWLGILFFRRATQPFFRVLGKGLFLAVGLLAFNAVRSHILRYSPWDQVLLYSKVDNFLIRPALGVGALLLLTRWRGLVFRMMTGALLVLAPFAAVTFAQAAWVSVKIQTGIPFADFSDQPSAPPLPGKPGSPRVIWLLFDGLSQRLAFDERPQDVEMPHLDRLQQQAIHASSAYPPGANTLESIPSLLMGAGVSYVRAVRANALRIQFDNTGEKGWWSEQPNVFTRARERGFNTALVGNYHPYGRVIGHSLTRCFWLAGRWDSLGMADPEAPVLKAVSRILATQANRMLASLPGLWRFGLVRPLEAPGSADLSEDIPHSIENYQRILKEAKAVVSDPAFQLVFIHWTVPHHPYIYDRQRDDFSQKGETHYEDNLELADRTLGEIRALLESSGQWDTAAILLTSDHAIHPHYDRIPFLLKLPGQTKGVLYERKRWSTLTVSNLLLAVLSREITDPQQVISWLDQKAPPVN